jgi:hypothetical protein
MIYNLLNVEIFIANFHKETNAACLHISEFNDRNNVINKKSRFIRKTVFQGKEVLYFSWVEYFSKYKKAKCIINYPLHNPCEFEVELKRIDEIVDQICEKYREIYKDPKTWKIYGHGIEDLLLRGILLNTANNTLELLVDS